MFSQPYSKYVDLEVQLKTLCEQEGLDLHLRLERVKRSVERIWANPRLHWFTDHSMTHSKNMIRLLGYLLSNVQSTPSSALTCSELFILLSSCYLHDIGMQVLSVNNKGVEKFTDHDYELIRAQHPEVTAELIINRSIRRQRHEFSIDLDDEPDYFMPIAYVCQAHGSKYFESTIRWLNETTYQPGGRPFRGVLLASLLMLADEFDLHQSRARIPNDQTLSPVSTLHHYIHKYITGVIISDADTEKERQVQVNMIFPKDSEDYQNLVIRWITGKLCKQIRRCYKLIKKESHGELSIRDKVIFLPHTSQTEHEPEELPDEAWNVLKKEVAEFEMVNQDKPREIYSQMLKSPPTVQSLLLISPDEKSEVESIDWLRAQCRYKGIDCHITNFFAEPYSINDLIQKMLRDLSTSSKEDFKEIESKANQNPLEVFIDNLVELSRAKQIIFVFQNFNYVENRVADWVYNQLLRKMNEAKLSTPLLLTCTAFPQIFEGGSRFQETVSWDTIAQESIEEAFLKYGFDGLEAQRNAMWLFTVSKGKPENVILGLELERSQWSVIL